MSKVPEIPFDKLIEAVEKPEVSDNAINVMAMLQEANRLLGQVEQMVTKLKNMGIFPAIVRFIGKKYGIDVETPLKTEIEQAIVPKSEKHRLVLMSLNELNEVEIEQVIEQIKKAYAAEEPKPPGEPEDQD